MTKLSPYYKEFAPPNEIAHLVDAFWSFSIPDFTACNHSVPYRVLPDGCMDLIFGYQRSINGGIYRPHLTVYGSTDRYYMVDIQPSTELIGVRFSPGMAGLFLRQNPIDLFQQEARAQDCSEKFVQVFDQLCECSSSAQAFNTLQINLLKIQRVDREDLSPSIREALRLISTNKGRISVSQVASAIGVSERTLRRGVTTAVGLPPKVLARILRFQNAVSLLRLAPKVQTPKEPPSSDLCRIALECGYADQAHMGREFQQLAGLTPSAFIS